MSSAINLINNIEVEPISGEYIDVTSPATGAGKII